MKLPIFLQQMALRTSAIFIVKVLGALARIPLFRLLGAEGIGLYQMAYSFYGLILTLVAGGFPTALSLMTAKSKQQGVRLFKFSFFFLALLGMVAGILSYKFALNIALYLGERQLTYAIQYVAPALFVAPLLAITRGFIQGIERYGAIAISEIIEQAVRVMTMLILTSFWIGYGSSFAVGGAVFGAFTGGAAALLFLIFLLHRLSSRNTEGNTDKLNHTQERSSYVFSMFFHTSLAILATRLIVPLCEFLDALIIPHRLQDAGMTVSQSTAIFGEITGMAATVVYLPTMFTAALSHTLAVKITGDWKNKKIKQFLRRSRLAIHLGWSWGIGSALFLYFYPYEISRLLFGTEQAVMAVRYMSVIPLVTGIRELTTTILWAKEQKREPIFGLIVGTCISVSLNYILVGIPGFGYEGAVIGILSLEFVAAAWNLTVLKRENRAFFLLFPLLIETLLLVFIGIVFYFSVNCLVFPGSFPFSPTIHHAVKMFVFYGGIAVYLFFRFLKVNKLKLFL